MTPILEAIIQNTPGYSQAYPSGVPRTFSWCAGTPGDSRPPPPGFTAVTAWAQIYQKAGAEAPAEATGQIEVAGAQTYVRLRQTGHWIRVQHQARDKVEGGHFVADFANNQAIPMTIELLPDGTASMELPPTGYNNHFWITPRGTFPQDSIDGVYVQMQMRATATNAQLVAGVGADWWRNWKAEYVDGFANNPGAGVSNWVVLGKNWSTLHFFSLSAPEIRRTPPPPLENYRIELNFEQPPLPPGPSPCLPIKRRDLRVAAGLDPQPQRSHEHQEAIKPGAGKRRRHPAR